MPRKRSSWGSNQPMGPGKRRIRYMADTGDGRGFTRHSETVYGTRKQADEVLAQRRIEHSQDKPVPTLQKAYETWLIPEFEDKLARNELRASSYSLYKRLWNCHVKPVFGSVPVSAIKPVDIQEWLLGLKKSSANKSLMLLKQVLDKCVMFEVIPSNPAAVSFRIPKTVTERNKEVFALSDLLKAIEAVRGTPAYYIAVLCGIGSCRVGEAIGVKAEDIKPYVYKGKTLAVIDLQRQYSCANEVNDVLKTGNSKRPIIIPEPWSKELLEAKSGWLVDKGNGKPVSQYVMRNIWHDALVAHDIDIIPLKNLRNSWRTIMRWELKVDADYVERMMGHAGKNVGEIYYDRPQWQQFADVVAEAWESYFENA